MDRVSLGHRYSFSLHGILGKAASTITAIRPLSQFGDRTNSEADNAAIEHSNILMHLYPVPLRPSSALGSRRISRVRRSRAMEFKAESQADYLNFRCALCNGDWALASNTHIFAECNSHFVTSSNSFSLDVVPMSTRQRSSYHYSTTAISLPASTNSSIESQVRMATLPHSLSKHRG